MKGLKTCFSGLLAMVIFAACDPYLGGDYQLTIDPVADALLEQTVGSETITAEGVSFTTTGAWTSMVEPVSTKSSQPMWVSITPDHGEEAGTYTVNINLEANDTGEDRKANIIISCGTQKITIAITQVATPQVPSDGGEDNTKPSLRCVSKIDYSYTDNAYDGSNDEHYTLTYRYDEKNRVVRVEELRESGDSYDDYERWYEFDYTIPDLVGVTRIYKSGGDDSHRNDSGYDVTFEGGRAKEAVLRSEYEDLGYTTNKYTFAYDNNGYLVEMASHSKDEGKTGSTGFMYTDGLLSAVTDGADGVMPLDIESYFPHRYLNDKINVDMNMFLINGGPQHYSLDATLISLRMCGKWGDCYVEIGGGGIEEYFNSPLEYVNDPNYNEHVSTTRTKINNGYWNAVYEFDADNCPTKISYDVVYDVFNIEYDKVADTSQSFPYNPNMGGRPGKDEDTGEVWYRVTTKNYTETKTGEIKCPAIYTITYKE